MCVCKMHSILKDSSGFFLLYLQQNSSTDLWPAMSFSLSSSPSLSLSLPPDKQWEAALGRNDEAQTQTSKEEEEEGPQRATEARVSLRALLQRHPSGHQGPKSQRHLRGCLQDCGLHVGQPRRGAEAGTKYTSVEEVKQKEEMQRKLLLNGGEKNRCVNVTQICFLANVHKCSTVCKSLHTVHIQAVSASHKGTGAHAPTHTAPLHKHPPIQYSHILFPPVDGMCAAAGKQPFIGIMCCVITRTLLWDTAHLNELVRLFLKIIHPFIPTPLTLIKMIFFLNLILAKGRRGRVGEYSVQQWL